MLLGGGAACLWAQTADLIDIIFADPQADLDNLKLGELPVPLGGGAALHARFQLEALLLTGQCIDPGAQRRDQVPARCMLLVLFRP